MLSKRVHVYGLGFRVPETTITKNGLLGPGSTKVVSFGRLWHVLKEY